MKYAYLVIAAVLIIVSGLLKAQDNAIVAACEKSGGYIVKIENGCNIKEKS